jgi:hypothetical protein
MPAARSAAARDPVSPPLPIVLRCADAIKPKVRYVFDTLLMARGIPAAYPDEAPARGAWVLYAPGKDARYAPEHCLAIAHSPDAWRLFSGSRDAATAATVDGLAAVFPERAAGFDPGTDVSFDIVANAFYFLSSWSERVATGRAHPRGLYPDSVFARLGVPQDIVDRYLERIAAKLQGLCERAGLPPWTPPAWPDGAQFALVLSHDVDFIPAGLGDTLVQGVKSAARHLLHQRDPGDALRSLAGLARALLTGRDAYGCIPEMIARERGLGLRASYQVATARRHPHDVNYLIEDDRVRDYLRVIVDAGFDLCLHGSYRSTEDPAWYAEEVAALARRLAAPVGSRQHYLSFSYDALFAAQERSGIRFDMSMGFPDRIGPRAGFSHPYFPYCLEEDRPYDVVEISLFLMDVTLRGYMHLKGERAWQAIEATLADLREKRGCVSVVWHPIVFGGARSPGYDRLFWAMADRVRNRGGLPTDGRTIDAFWRERARRYPSFASPASRRDPAAARLASASRETWPTS